LQQAATKAVRTTLPAIAIIVAATTAATTPVTITIAANFKQR